MTEQTKEQIEIEEETASQFLIRLGIDGDLWAEEFMKIMGNKKENIDLDLMRSWFCNAIMAGYDNSYPKGIKQGKAQYKKDIAEEICPDCKKSYIEQGRTQEREIQEVEQEVCRIRGAKEEQERMAKLAEDSKFCVRCMASPEFCKCDSAIKFAVWSHIISKTKPFDKIIPKEWADSEIIFKDKEQEIAKQRGKDWYECGLLDGGQAKQENILKIIADWVEDSTHYKTYCEKCGTTWGSNHCIHDGCQGRCPKCNTRPEDSAEGECNCEFWLNPDELISKINHSQQTEIKSRSVEGALAKSTILAKNEIPKPVDTKRQEFEKEMEKAEFNFSELKELFIIEELLPYFKDGELIQKMKVRLIETREARQECFNQGLSKAKEIIDDYGVYLTAIDKEDKFDEKKLKIIYNFYNSFVEAFKQYLEEAKQ